MLPSWRHQATVSPFLTRPLRIRHSARRPTYGRGVEVGDQRLEGMALLVRRRRDALDQQVEEHLEVRAVGHVLGGQGGLAGPGVAVHDRELDLVLVRAEVDEQLVDRVDAPRPARASGRSILLMTQITGSRASSVLRSTKRVWGRGPSLASTRSSTPSTMVRPRSTSPPKSAWPGVSTMLMVRSP